MGKRTNTASWVEKKKHWRIDVQKDGERKSFYSSIPGRNGQREANRKADAWLDDGIFNARLKVTDLLDDYLKDVEEKTSSTNLRKEKYHIENFIRPALKNKKIDSLTEQDLQSIINKAYKTKDVDGNNVFRSKKTLENIRYTISAFLKFCRKKKVTTLYPEDLSIPKGARKKPKTILQPADIIKLFNVDTTVLRGSRCFDEYIYAYRFAVVSGLRPGELRALKAKNLKGYSLHIEGSINVQNEFTPGKNENATRTIYLSQTAYDIIHAQLELKPETEYIFDIASTSTFRHRWQKYCEVNGITITSLYELRHTFVSIVKNLPEGSVKQLVGHSKNMDTFGIYGHQLTGEIRKQPILSRVFLPTFWTPKRKRHNVAP